MVRTKADQRGGAFRKVLGGRAPRKVQGPAGIPAASPPAARRGRRCPTGQNPVCVRPVPAWQRSIGEFLRPPPKESRAPDGAVAGSSGLG
ncbi:PAF15 factor, partial [Grallaria varia]|nr:PAF15 factor [Grallaria varia]